MQYTIATLTTLFAAALSAPSDFSPRQAALTTLGIWSRSGCAEGSFVNTTPITNVATCQKLPAGITASKVQTRLPAGCSLVFHTDDNCQSQQIITIPRDVPTDPTGCFEAGQGKVWGSVITSGTCA